MKLLPILCLGLLLPVLAACGDGGLAKTLGLNREAPDEFTVVSRPPLSVPPEFSLRPPAPGEAPRGLPADERAKNLLTGKEPPNASSAEKPAQEAATSATTPTNGLSAGASSLLKRAGADEADETVREKLGVDAVTPMDTSKADTLLERLAGDDKKEPTVDAKKEAERLRTNKDEKKPVTEGDVPEEAPKKPSLIDRIF